MSWFEPIKQYFSELEEKTFFQYSAIALGVVTVILAITLFFYYRSVSSLHDQIEELNSTRDQVQKILERAQQVSIQKKEVNELLAQEPNFKIKGYLESLLAQLGLTRKVASEIQVTPAIGEGVYDEKILTLQLADITEKDILTLVDAIEEKRRIYTKELEINRSKMPNRIDATVVIGTLEPKE